MSRIRPGLAAFVLVVSFVLLGWGIRPVPRERRILTVSPSETVLLDYPGEIRAGDSDSATLTFDLGPGGGLSGAAQAAGGPGADLYATHSVVAEATLAMDGASIQPGGAVSEPLLPGESVSFRWNVLPLAQGSSTGTAWLVLVLTDKSTGEQSRTAVSAQPVVIQGATLLGLGGTGARVVGGLGIVLGFVLGLPSLRLLAKHFWPQVAVRIE